MITRKGICDVCTTQFELDEGSFAVRIREENDLEPWKNISSLKPPPSISPLVCITTR
jgi:hypothetical protein